MTSSRLLLASFVTAVALALGGCATPSNPQAMSVQNLSLAKKHAASLSLNVTGGNETSSAGASKISNADFATALKSSIESSELFARLLETGAADYHLEVMIARLDQPMMGLNMTVTFETNWTLSRKSDGSVVWQKAIPSTYTAKMGDAFAGPTRLRLANEGAARANIEQAIKELSALSL
jgi:hypothetical protein